VTTLDIACMADSVSIGGATVEAMSAAAAIILQRSRVGRGSPRERQHKHSSTGEQGGWPSPFRSGEERGSRSYLA
jgi:hypothetical protein